MGLELKQYEIGIVKLDPTIVGEIKIIRPCVVLSPNEMNKYLRTIIIAPITSQSKPYPTMVKIKLSGKKNWAVIDQIRTIDRKRISKKAGDLKDNEIQKIQAALKESFVDKKEEI